MTHNKLEKIFSSSAKEQFNWYIKLHNNPLAHQNTPADYICSYKTIDYYKFILVECKQVTCVDRKGRLAFKRLKQMHDLLTFENIHNRGSAFFCIAYYDKRWDNSEVYLIPVPVLNDYINIDKKLSLNREKAKIFFFSYLVEISKGELKLAKKLLELI